MNAYDWIIIGLAGALLIAKSTILVLHYRLRVSVYERSKGSK